MMLKNFIPGWKTNITTVTLSVIPLLGLVGISVDQEAALQFIEEFDVWIGATNVFIGVAGIYFRKLADR